MIKFTCSKMLFIIVGLYIFLGCQSAMAASTDIYRAVDANPNNGHASLAPGQFNFNPELSTFDNPALAPVQKRCNYRFNVTGPNVQNPPQQGDSGIITGLGYVATFDNNPPGHWSISHPAGIPPQQARAAVSAFAQANRNGNVVNGTLQNCN
jgi:hypothetical protein